MSDLPEIKTIHSGRYIPIEKFAKLEAENERLRRAIQTELDNVIADGWINREALAKALEKADEM